MKTDEDEVYLSAYLDGELDPHERTSVESAMLSNPALAEHYRQLAAVRDLIANLPRPTLQDDLTPAILTRLSTPAPRTLVARFGRLPLARFGLTAAALILLALGLALLPTRPGPLQPPLVAANPTAPALHPQVHPTPDSQVEPKLSDSPVAENSSGRSLPILPSQTVAEHNEVDLESDREQTRIRELLDSPDLKHVYIVVDEIGGNTPDQVEGLVKNTPRIDPDFGKITVSQGIVIDPQHPNQATVFALVMDQNEVDLFRARLNQDFPNQVKEVAPDPSVVTQLSDIGQVAILSGTRATELAATPATESPKTALRTRGTSKNSELIVSPEFDGLPVPVVPRRPPPSSDKSLEIVKSPPERESSSGPRLTSGPPSDAASEPATLVKGESPNQAGRRPTSVVLVWVTSSDSIRKTRY